MQNHFTEEITSFTEKQELLILGKEMSKKSLTHHVLLTTVLILTFMENITTVRGFGLNLFTQS